MKDETYAFISDVKEKKTTARSARHMRTHCGKGGRVRLPSDNLSKKELMKMNGECKSYRLNDPMSREELLAMPDDLKIVYIQAIRSKYGIPDKHLGQAMGFAKDKAEIAWLRNECDNHRMNARILEAQMDVVRLIFGGKNHG